MKRVGKRGTWIAWIVTVVVVAAVAVSLATGAPVLPAARSAVPSAKVVRGPLKLTVFATGELRAGRTVSLMAPPAGGSLRIVKLIPTGASVKKDDVGDRVRRGRPGIRSSNRRKSDLAEAEQQIVKMRADQAVQASQDKLDVADRALRRPARRARCRRQRVHRRDRGAEERADARGIAAPAAAAGAGRRLAHRDRPTPRWRS